MGVWVSDWTRTCHFTHTPTHPHTHTASPARLLLLRLVLAESEVLLAAVAQPDAQDLRDLFLLHLRQGLVQPQGPGALPAAGRVVVRVPLHPGQPDQAAYLLHQLGPRQRL